MGYFVVSYESANEFLDVARQLDTQVLLDKSYGPLRHKLWFAVNDGPSAVVHEIIDAPERIADALSFAKVHDRGLQVINGSYEWVQR